MKKAKNLIQTMKIILKNNILIVYNEKSHVLKSTCKKMKKSFNQTIIVSLLSKPLHFDACISPPCSIFKIT
jgi:hypothetical protein